MSSSKDSKYEVVSETIPSGFYFLESPFFMGPKDYFFTSSLISCELIDENRSTEHTNSGRLAGGVLGLVVAGPIGALAGLMTGGKKSVDEIQFFCELDDGRNFIAKCNKSAYAKIKGIILSNKAKINHAPLPQVADIKPKKISNRKNKASIINDDDSKDCPSCSESVKFRARSCRFCNFKFDLVTGQKFGKGFSEFKQYFYSYPLDSDSYKISDEDMAITFYIFRAIENQFKHISKKYTLDELKDYIAYDWGDGFEGETPDEFYVRLSESSYIGEKINQLALGDDDPEDEERNEAIYNCVVEAIKEYRRKYG